MSIFKNAANHILLQKTNFSQFSRSSVLLNDPVIVLPKDETNTVFQYFELNGTLNIN